MIVVIMGVSGVGKTTAGKLLADRLGWPFFEGDDYHPEANVAKMSEGIPLTDDDRKPWLEAIHRLIENLVRTGQSAVIACSALKESYRALLKDDVEEVQFVFLRDSYDLLKERLEGREDHFFDPELLRSQFKDLEIPRNALDIHVDKPPEDIANEIRERLAI